MSGWNNYHNFNEDATEKLAANGSAAMVTFASGAKRTDKKPRFDLIQRDFLAQIAQVLTTGAEKYGIGNWQKGDREFAVDAINHVIDHVFMFAQGDRSEPHLIHAACGLMFIDYFHTQNPFWFVENED